MPEEFAKERIELHMVAFEGFVMPEEFVEDTRTQIGNSKVCIILNYFCQKAALFMNYLGEGLL